MYYKTRPGVALIQICGVDLLVPTRAVSQECPNIHRLSLLSGITWTLLEENEPKVAEEKIMEIHRILSKKSEEEIRARLDRFYVEMYEKGYLIRAEEE